MAGDVRKRRVLVLLHRELLPPDTLEGASRADIEECKTEYHVVHTLRELGHEVQILGVDDELAPIRRAIADDKPHIVFNLLEAFRNIVAYDQHVVSYLELLRVPYTGCNPRGLTLARDKALAKKILAYHRVRMPEFAVFPIGRRARRPKHLQYPVIVKSLIEDASFGISQASLVHNDEKLAERVAFIHRHTGSDAIAERFIEGRELYVSVLGNVRLEVYPPWELFFRNKPPEAPLIATEKAKFDVAYQERQGVTHDRAEGLSPELEGQLQTLSKRIYRILGLAGGYARMDFRLDDKGDAYFLEANPNPEIAADEELASAAASVGVAYPQLLQKLLNLGLKRRAQ